MQRWTADWARLGLHADAAWRDRLLASYAEPGRHYYTLQHLAECLELCAQVEHLAAHPGEVALALWFHDAVYVPTARDNEARSAQWAREALRAAGADPAVVARVETLIMATCHHGAPPDGDAHLVVDIDLAILGAAPARFAKYDQQVRAEYAAVPLDVYRQKRRAVLLSFLNRPALYTTPALHARFDRQARLNLRHAVASSSPDAL
nr:N-methyl-D-aspartate receptor NMDAR2C subunit [Massilia sp. Leaf139]